MPTIIEPMQQLIAAGLQLLGVGFLALLVAAGFKHLVDRIQDTLK